MTVPPMVIVPGPSPGDLVPTTTPRPPSDGLGAEATAEQDDRWVDYGGLRSCFYFGGRGGGCPGNVRSANMTARLQRCLDDGRARN